MEIVIMLYAIFVVVLLLNKPSVDREEKRRKDLGAVHRETARSMNMPFDG